MLRWKRWQIRAALAWIEMDLSEPGKLESYLMQLTATVASLPAWLNGKQSKVKMDSFRLAAEAEPPKEEWHPFPRMTKEQAANVRAAIIRAQRRGVAVSVKG